MTKIIKKILLLLPLFNKDIFFSTRLFHPLTQIKLNDLGNNLKNFGKQKINTQNIVSVLGNVLVLFCSTSIKNKSQKNLRDRQKQLRQLKLQDQQDGSSFKHESTDPLDVKSTNDGSPLPEDSKLKTEKDKENLQPLKDFKNQYNKNQYKNPLKQSKILKKKDDGLEELLEQQQVSSLQISIDKENNQAKLTDFSKRGNGNSTGESLQNPQRRNFVGDARRNEIPNFPENQERFFNNGEAAKNSRQPGFNQEDYNLAGFNQSKRFNNINIVDSQGEEEIQDSKRFKYSTQGLETETRKKVVSDSLCSKSKNQGNNQNNHNDQSMILSMKSVSTADDSSYSGVYSASDQSIFYSSLSQNVNGDRDGKSKVNEWDDFPTSDSRYNSNNKYQAERQKKKRILEENSSDVNSFQEDENVLRLRHHAKPYTKQANNLTSQYFSENFISNDKKNLNPEILLHNIKDFTQPRKPKAKLGLNYLVDDLNLPFKEHNPSQNRDYLLHLLQLTSRLSKNFYKFKEVLKVIDNQQKQIYTQRLIESSDDCSNFSSALQTEQGNSYTSYNWVFRGFIADTKERDLLPRHLSYKTLSQQIDNNRFGPVPNAQQVNYPDVVAGYGDNLGNHGNNDFTRNDIAVYNRSNGKAGSADYFNYSSLFSRKNIVPSYDENGSSFQGYGFTETGNYIKFFINKQNAIVLDTGLINCVLKTIILNLIFQKDFHQNDIKTKLLLTILSEIEAKNLEPFTLLFLNNSIEDGNVLDQLQIIPTNNEIEKQPMIEMCSEIINYFFLYLNNLIINSRAVGFDKSFDFLLKSKFNSVYGNFQQIFSLNGFDVRSMLSIDYEYQYNLPELKDKYDFNNMSTSDHGIFGPSSYNAYYYRQLGLLFQEKDLLTVCQEDITSRGFATHLAIYNGSLHTSADITLNSEITPSDDFDSITPQPYAMVEQVKGSRIGRLSTRGQFEEYRDIFLRMSFQSILENQNTYQTLFNLFFLQNNNTLPSRQKGIVVASGNTLDLFITETGDESVTTIVVEKIAVDNSAVAVTESFNLFQERRIFTGELPRYQVAQTNEIAVDNSAVAVTESFNLFQERRIFTGELPRYQVAQTNDLIIDGNLAPLAIASKVKSKTPTVTIDLFPTNRIDQVYNFSDLKEEDKKIADSFVTFFNRIRVNHKDHTSIVQTHKDHTSIVQTKNQINYLLTVSLFKPLNQNATQRATEFIKNLIKTQQPQCDISVFNAIFEQSRSLETLKLFKPFNKFINELNKLDLLYRDENKSFQSSFWGLITYFNGKISNSNDNNTNIKNWSQMLHYIHIQTNLNTQKNLLESISVSVFILMFIVNNKQNILITQERDKMKLKFIRLMETIKQNAAISKSTSNKFFDIFNKSLTIKVENNGLFSAVGTFLGVTNIKEISQRENLINKCFPTKQKKEFLTLSENSFFNFLNKLDEEINQYEYIREIEKFFSQRHANQTFSVLIKSRFEELTKDLIKTISLKDTIYALYRTQDESMVTDLQRSFFIVLILYCLNEKKHKDHERQMQKQKTKIDEKFFSQGKVVSVIDKSELQFHPRDNKFK